MALSLSDQLVATRNRPAGFDWLRIGLASSIVGWHSIVISYGSDFQNSLWLNPWLHPLLVSLLGMFFALSGFLVAGSLERCKTMVSFAGLRVMRIFPALVVETLLSAFILGPLLTDFDIAHYFSAPEFRTYLLNTLGLVNFSLPGLFLGNPSPAIVNAQLWTVPFELRCYEVLVVLAVVGIYARRWLLVATIAILTAAIAGKAVYTNHYDIYSLTGNQLVLCFLCGVMFFRFRSSVAWSVWIFAPAVLATIALASVTGGANFVPLPIAYVTVYLGLLNPPRNKLLFSGDYSYGLFLYGFPVQQTIASLGPWTHHWYVSVALAAPITVMIAVGSWWLIEKPVLSHKGLLLKLEDKIVAAVGLGRNWWTTRSARRGTLDRPPITPAERES